MPANACSRRSFVVSAAGLAALSAAAAMNAGGPVQAQAQEAAK